MSDGMKLYLSGPISSKPYECAYEAFENAEHALVDRGFEVVNPMALTYKGMPRDECMRIVIPKLAECDGLVLLVDWERSDGAKLERDIAFESGLMVGRIDQWEQLQPFDWFSDSAYAESPAIEGSADDIPGVLHDVYKLSSGNLKMIGVKHDTRVGMILPERLATAWTQAAKDRGITKTDLFETLLLEYLMERGWEIGE